MISQNDLRPVLSNLVQYKAFEQSLKDAEVEGFHYHPVIFSDFYIMEGFGKVVDTSQAKVDGVRLENLPSEFVEALRGLDLGRGMHITLDMHPEYDQYTFSSHTLSRDTFRKGDCSYLSPMVDAFNEYIEECLESGQGMLPLETLEKMMLPLLDRAFEPVHDLMRQSLASFEPIDRSRVKEGSFGSPWEPDEVTSHVVVKGSLEETEARMETLRLRFNLLHDLHTVTDFESFKTVTESLTKDNQGFEDFMVLLTKCLDFEDASPYFAFADDFLSTWAAEICYLRREAHFPRGLVARYCKAHLSREEYLEIRGDEAIERKRQMKEFTFPLF